VVFQTIFLRGERRIDPQNDSLARFRNRQQFSGAQVDVATDFLGREFRLG